MPSLERIRACVEMYAFYSLLVYIFYSVFKKEEEAAVEEEGPGGAAAGVCRVCALKAMWLPCAPQFCLFMCQD